MKKIRLPSFQILLGSVTQNHRGSDSTEVGISWSEEDIRRQSNPRFTQIDLDQINQLDRFSFIKNDNAKFNSHNEQLEWVLSLSELDKLMESFNDVTPIIEEVKLIIESTEDKETIKDRIEEVLNEFGASSIEAHRINSAKVKDHFKKLLEFKLSNIEDLERVGAAKVEINRGNLVFEDSRNTTISPEMDVFAKRTDSLSPETETETETTDSYINSPVYIPVAPQRTNHPQGQRQGQGQGQGQGHAKGIKLPTGPVSECQQCCTADTPEWRKGPIGPRTLCNACGLFYSKLVKKFGTNDANKIMEHRKPDGVNIDRRVPLSLSELS